MDKNRDWKFIQKSMEVEGYVISDDELAQIAAEYEKTGQHELVTKALSRAKSSGKSALEIAADLVTQEALKK